MMKARVKEGVEIIDDGAQMAEIEQWTEEE